MDSIQTNTQSAGQKRQRHRDNILVLQNNMTDQLRDLNAGLETLIQQHPTLDLTGMFMSVHALDSNHRALLDLAKEASGIEAGELPPPPRLIDHTSSNDPNKSGGAPPSPFTHINIDDTNQPHGNPATNPASVRKPSPDLAPATEATQAQQNNIAVRPGSAT